MTCQSTDSVNREAEATPTDGRTDRRTQNLQDQGDILPLRNAHENSGKTRQPQMVGSALLAACEQIATANERHPVIRTNRPGKLDPEIRKAVLRRDHWCCLWCKRGISDDVRLEVDHILPWSAGGTNATDNLRTLCLDCNQGRSNTRADSDSAKALLIVGNCPLCYLPDDPDAELGESDREAPVWCLRCRKPSSTDKAHAASVRRRQANRWAPV